MAASRTIAVAGAGIGGLTTALALAAKGYRIVLLERAPALQEVGAGLQLSPNATRILIELGLRSRLEQRVIVPDSIGIFSGAKGRELASIPLGDAANFRYGAPYWVLHRADLQAALREAVEEHPDIELRLGATFQDVASHANGLTVVYRQNDRNHQDLALALVGADGVWSAVRGQLGKEVQPKFSGYVVWRGMANTSQLSRVQTTKRVQLWLGSGAHLVAYPMRDERYLNLVAVIGSTWSRPGWNEAADPAEIGRAFSHGKWSASARLLINAVDEWRRFALYEMPSPLWGAEKIALVGDASHAMLPFAAQGAGMAIEDAAVLANCLVREPNDIVAAIKQYGAQRSARVERVMRTARQNGKIYHVRKPVALARDLVIQASPGSRLLQRQDWIYDWQAG